MLTPEMADQIKRCQRAAVKLRHAEVRHRDCGLRAEMAVRERHVSGNELMTADDEFQAEMRQLRSMIRGDGPSSMILASIGGEHPDVRPLRPDGDSLVGFGPQGIVAGGGGGGAATDEASAAGGPGYGGNRRELL